MKVFHHENITLGKITLSEEESKHAVKVLRLKDSDQIFLIDGKGGLFEGEISGIHPKKCEVNVIKQMDVYKRNYYKHIAIAPPKSIDRFEWFLEKATEIGIDEITPILTERSERKVIKLDRCERVISATMKQCIQPFRPKINEITTLKELLNSKLKVQNSKFIAHLETGEEEQLQKVYEAGSDCLILIGPEGDFTPNEVKLTTEKGFTPISLGHSRLRVETAGVVACHTIAIKNND